MADQSRVTDEDVLGVFNRVSETNESLSAREVADALGCSRRTAYNRLSALTDSEHLQSKKVGNVRIWWVATDTDHPCLETADGAVLSEHTASQTLQLEFQSVEMAQPFVESSSHAVDIAVEHVIELEDGTQLQYWNVSGISLGAYLDIIEQPPTVIDVTVISSVDGVHRIEIHSTDDSLFATFSAYEGHPSDGRFEDETLKIIAEFPATVDDDAVVEEIRKTYPDFECVSRQLLSTPELSRILLEESLSERQWTAFQLAYYAGYFERPRKSTGEDIADRMNITRQTFHRHLRESQQRVAQFIMEDLDDHRVLDSVQTE